MRAFALAAAAVVGLSWAAEAAIVNWTFTATRMLPVTPITDPYFPDYMDLSFSVTVNTSHSYYQSLIEEFELDRIVYSSDDPRGALLGYGFYVNMDEIPLPPEWHPGGISDFAFVTNFSYELLADGEFFFRDIIGYNGGAFMNWGGNIGVLEAQDGWKTQFYSSTGFTYKVTVIEPDIAPVPLPASAALIMSGIVGLTGLRTLRRRPTA